MELDSFRWKSYLMGIRHLAAQTSSLDGDGHARKPSKPCNSLNSKRHGMPLLLENSMDQGISCAEAKEASTSKDDVLAPVGWTREEPECITSKGQP
jgi:hypothetical protein